MILCTKDIHDNGVFTLTIIFVSILQATRENLFFSPYSVHQTLLLAYFASKGETQNQLQNALHIDGDEASKAQLIQLFKLNNFFQVCAS